MASALASTHNGPTVWVIPSLQRVGPNDPAGSTILARLFAARGEYESFQIVVQAPAGIRLTNVNVNVSDLTTPNGRNIPKSNITLFREQYVQVTKSSPDWGGPNRPLGNGWYPDGLIPFVDPKTGEPSTGNGLRAAPFDLAARTNQPIWVDIFVPRSSAAGQYTGAFTVTSDQGNSGGQINLEVWNFTLPLTPSLKSAFISMEHPGASVARTLLRNRVSPLTVAPEDANRLMNEFGLRAANLGFFSGADVSNCTASDPPGVDEIRAVASKYPRGLDLFNFTADEIGDCPSLLEQMRLWGAALHRGGAGNMVTMAPTPELFDDGAGTGRSAVDIWGVLPEMYVKATNTIAQALAKGDEVWSYNTLVQDAYSPKWEIDFAPINFRVQPGFISQSLHLTGLLYWRVDKWSSDPWHNVNNTGTFSSNNYPGEGVLVYPGQAVGFQEAAPSIRLKWIRDGVEDYEYVALLKKAGLTDWALQIVRRVGPDWKTWTRDPNVLESARKQLGSRLASIGPT